MSTSKSFLEYVNDVDMDGLWSGGQSTSLLLLRSEFVSRWSLQFFLQNYCLKRLKMNKRGRGWSIFIWNIFWRKCFPFIWWNILGCNHSSVDSSATYHLAALGSSPMYTIYPVIIYCPNLCYICIVKRRYVKFKRRTCDLFPIGRVLELWSTSSHGKKVL